MLGRNGLSSYLFETPLKSATKASMDQQWQTGAHPVLADANWPW